MLNQADKIGFANFQDQYVSGATDMPSTFLTVSAPGRPAKTVRVEEGAPAELTSLLTYIGKEIDGISSASQTYR